jgi:hypothetical protein
MPVTTGSFEEQPRWAGDGSVEFRSSTGTQSSGLQAEDTVVAECAPPDYDEGSDPHNGRLDSSAEDG